METVAFYHTLETFTFCGTYYFNLIAFSENVDSNCFTNIFFNGKISEFFGKPFGSGLSFCEVILFCFSGVVLFFVAERKLECIVAVRLFCLNLGNHAGSCFNDSTGGLFACGIENTRHPDFFPNNTFHVDQFMPAGLLGHSSPIERGQSPFAADLFCCFPDMYREGEVPAVNKP
jgi:hypothetical protein